MNKALSDVQERCGCCLYVKDPTAQFACRLCRELDQGRAKRAEKKPNLAASPKTSPQSTLDSRDELERKRKEFIFTIMDLLNPPSETGERVYREFTFSDFFDLSKQMDALIEERRAELAVHNIKAVVTLEELKTSTMETCPIVKYLLQMLDNPRVDHDRSH